MSIYGIPYPSDATAHDRKYTTALDAKGDSVFVTSGLGVKTPATDALVAKVAGTMQVSIQPCEAVLAGHRIISDAVSNVTLPVGNSSPRIDVIVFESNSNTAVRNPRFAYVQGTPSPSPTVPALSQTDTLYQIPLAYVPVAANATNLDASTITDQRVFAFGKHYHNQSDVQGLTTALSGKAPSSHTHAESDINGLVADLAGKAAIAHTHSTSQVSGLDTALAAKQKVITVSANDPSGGTDGDIWLKTL